MRVSDQISIKSLPEQKTKRVIVYKAKRAHVADVKFTTWFPVPLLILFILIFVSLFSLRKFLPCLLCGAVPLVFTLKLIKKNFKLAESHVKEMHAIYKIPLEAPPKFF